MTNIELAQKFLSPDEHGPIEYETFDNYHHWFLTWHPKNGFIKHHVCDAKEFTETDIYDESRVPYEAIAILIQWLQENIDWESVNARHYLYWYASGLSDLCGLLEAYKKYGERK